MFNRIKKYLDNRTKKSHNQLMAMLNRKMTFLKSYTIDKHKAGLIQLARNKTPNNPMLYGYKVYSQNDEDGIINYLFNKISGNKTFIEFGCGNGLENNTHLLLLSNWKGVWIDGAEENINFIKYALKNKASAQKLLVDRQFISLKNIDSIYESCISFLNVTHPAFISIDIDGVDYYIIEHLLEKGVRPKVFCVEYNAKFPPPLDVKILYREDHIWKHDDYQSASIQCWVNLMNKFDYFLVCCNLSGINAFFVQGECRESFEEYSIEDLYQRPRYYFSEENNGHGSSLNFLKDLLID